MPEGILLRIADATQRQHELLSELRGLSMEFNELIRDLEDKTNELQRRFPTRPLDPQEQAKQQKDPPYYDPQANVAMSMGNIVTMPTTEDFPIPSMLRNGPIKRGD